MPLRYCLSLFVIRMSLFYFPFPSLTDVTTDAAHWGPRTLTLQRDSVDEYLSHVVQVDGYAILLLYLPTIWVWGRLLRRPNICSIKSGLTYDLIGVVYMGLQLEMVSPNKHTGLIVQRKSAEMAVN